jgi:hypothetical protein
MDTQTTLQVYKELADWYERQGQAAMRDRFLILAAEAAFSSGNSEEAERLRLRLLQGNPHHMLKPFSSFAQALQSKNIQIYIHDLQVNYPPEMAENLLRELHKGVLPTPSPTPEEEAPQQTRRQTTFPIEPRDESTRLLEPATEPFKVYPLRDESKSAVPAAPPVKPAQAPRSAPRKATSLPPRPRSQSLRPQPTELPPPPEIVAPAGAWLSLLLFGMTLTAGVVLAFYTLARPFLSVP